MTLSPAIGARRGQAIERLSATMQAISEKYGIENVAGSVHNVRRDINPYVAQMLEIEAFDVWTTTLAEKLGVTLPEPKPAPPAPVPFDGIEIEGLKALARDKGIPFTDTTSEGDLRKALLQHIGWNAPVAPEPDDQFEPIEVKPVKAADLEMMTIPQLRAEADRRDVDLTGLTLKADIIAAIAPPEPEDPEESVPDRSEPTDEAQK